MKKYIKVKATNIGSIGKSKIIIIVRGAIHIFEPDSLKYTSKTGFFLYFGVLWCKWKLAIKGPQKLSYFSLLSMYIWTRPFQKSAKIYAIIKLRICIGKDKFLFQRNISIRICPVTFIVEIILLKIP